MFPSENRTFFGFGRQNINADTSSGIRYRIREIFRIQFVDCNEKVAGILVAIIGLLTSLWANCILVVSSVQDYRTNTMVEFYIEKNIIQTSQLSHFTLVITCTTGLLYGFKIKNRSFSVPWIFIKIIELVVMLLGIIIISTGNHKYIGVVPFGICFLVIGVYITMCVWDTYKNTPDFNMINMPHLTEVYVSTPSLTDLPPSYDETCVSPTQIQLVTQL